MILLAWRKHIDIIHILTINHVVYMKIRFEKNTGNGVTNIGLGVFYGRDEWSGFHVLGIALVFWSISFDFSE